MNLKLFTLSLLLLFFTVKVNSQETVVNTYTPTANNILDIKLAVTDTNKGQKFTLHSDNVQYAAPNFPLRLLINLDYQSELDTTTYFRLRCALERKTKITPSEPAFGITAPVLIPPVKKKRNSDYRPSNDHEYPYLLDVADHEIQPTIYLVKISLYEYANYDDYIHNRNSTPGPKLEFNLIANTSNPIMNRSSQSSLEIKTYPNPSTSHIIIDQINATIVNTPLKVVVFNDKGVKVSQYNLTGTHKVPYTLDISDLQKGIYYFKLSNGVKTQTKTIVKK